MKFIDFFSTFILYLIRVWLRAKSIENYPHQLSPVFTTIISSFGLFRISRGVGARLAPALGDHKGSPLMSFDDQDR